MNDDLDNFNREIDDFGKSIPNKVVELQKKIVLEALRRIALKTPVDTGRARGNWQTTIAKAATNQLDVVDKQGDETIAKGLTAIKELPPYQVVYIANNVEYIEFLEEGSSKQAADGMVKTTVEELRQIFK